MLSYNHRLFNDIQRLHAEHQTGVLSLANAEDERVDVVFSDGFIDAVSLKGSPRSSAHRLGHYLVEDGLLAPDELGAVLSEARRRSVSLGEAAIDTRLVDRVDVGIIARRQSVDLIKHVLENGFSLDSFTLARRTYRVPAALGFQHLQLELAREQAAPLELEPEQWIVLSDGSDLSSFPWYPEELSVLSALFEPTTLGSLETSTGLDAARVKRVLGVLDSLELIEKVNKPRAKATAARKKNGNGVVDPAAFPFERLIPVTTNAVLDEKLEMTRTGPSFANEQFKSLKVQIKEAYTEGDRPSVFAVSSPEPRDGKSLVSSNLAFSFSMDSKRRVVLVDCDLRSPSVDRYLGVTPEPGLLQYLESSHLSPYCFLRRCENLYYLPAGGVSRNPVEHLSMEKMRDLVERLKKDFDTVVLDAPPYSPITDARLVTGLSDALILVVRQGKCTFGSVDRAFKAIPPKKLLGVVFNAVKPLPFHTQENYGYYSYGYGKGYGYGYGYGYGGEYLYPDSGNKPKTTKSPKTYLDA